jgi:hypothetical protein
MSVFSSLKTGINIESVFTNCITFLMYAFFLFCYFCWRISMQAHIYAGLYLCRRLDWPADIYEGIYFMPAFILCRKNQSALVSFSFKAIVKWL